MEKIWKMYRFLSVDVKNVLGEVHFEDELTRSRCRGWLVLPSRRYLQADILFPGCEFDCRLTIRERLGMLWHKYLCCLYHNVNNKTFCANNAQYL